MMNLENVRSSFVIYSLETFHERMSLISSSLKSRDFQITDFIDAKSLQATIAQEPPHILILNFESIKDLEVNYIDEINKISPETRIILTASKKHFAKAYEVFNDETFDYIFSDFFEDDEVELDRRFALANILKTVDHAVEMDYFKFKNEQLSAETNGNVDGQSQSVLLLHNLWLKKLDKCDSFSSSTDCFMEEISRYVKSSGIFYLKYVPAYKSLVSARAKNIEDFTVGETFDLTTLLDIESINEYSFENSSDFRDLIYKYTKWLQFSIIPLKINGMIKGIFILDTDKATEVNSYILACVNSLALKVSNIVLERKLHTTRHKDEVTDLFNRQYLLGRLKDEISRARRINLPVSFLLISIDNFRGFLEATNSHEINSVVRLIAKLLAQTSRINDIVGRISSDEFGIILPHTPYNGALIKADRIRELIESTDLSTVSPNLSKVTASLALSEYPCHCSDVNEMLEIADKALAEVSRYGGNQVCLSTAPKSFKPDFSYK